MEKTVSIKITNAIFLAIVLVAVTITLFPPSFMKDAQAQQDYYGINNNYENDYGKDSDKSKDNVFVNKINCNNINVNVNGLELDGLPPFLGNLIPDGDAYGYSDVSSYGNSERSYGSGQSDSGKDFRFICINNNNNTIIEEEPIPSTTASLTVKKQVFGCDNFDPIEMDCDFQNNSEEWLDCNDSAISGTIFCQSLPESIFDIAVLDDQNNQIQQFQNSEQGTKSRI